MIAVFYHSLFEVFPPIRNLVREYQNLREMELSCHERHGFTLQQSACAARMAARGINGIGYELNSIIVEKWEGKAYRLVIQRERRLDGEQDL